MRLRSPAVGVLGLAAVAALCAPPRPAQAALGRAFTSVEIDRAMMGASLRSNAASGYTVHTLALPNQGTVREFTRADGTVFAVVWQGPARPDLSQLLGESFTTVQTDNPGRVGGGARRPLTVNRPELVVTSGGHSGAFWGAALLPLLQPAGFTAASLK